MGNSISTSQMILKEEINGCLRIHAPQGEEGTIFLFVPVFGEGNQDKLAVLGEFLEFRHARGDGWSVGGDMIAGIENFIEDEDADLNDRSLWFDLKQTEELTITRVSDINGTYYVVTAKNQWAMVFRVMGLYNKTY